jgi:hypothetical protein
MATERLPAAYAHARTWARRNRFGLGLFAATWLVLLVWWAAYFPGLFSPDSLAYIWQVTTSHWDNHHSVLYNALVWLSLYGTGGVATLTFLQTVTTAAGLGYAATHLRRLGAPAWALAIAAIGTVAIPSVGTLVICVWKDVGYTIASLFVLGTVAQLVRLRLEDPPAAIRRGLWLLLAGELSVVALMRPNGFVVVALAGLAGAVLLRGLRWRLAAVGVGAGLLALLAGVVIFPLVGVRNVFSDASAGPTLGDIAVVYADHPGDFSQADLTLMQGIGPLAVWRSSATCISSDTTYYNPQFDANAITADLGELDALWLRLVRAEPGDVLATRLCRGQVGWKPYEVSPQDHLTGNPTTGYSAFLSPTFEQSPYAGAVYRAPLSQRLVHWTAKWSSLFSARFWEPIQWRGAFWAYLSYLALLIVALRRRSLAWLALGALTLANQLVVIGLTPAPAARYMFAPLMLGPLLVCLAFVPGRTRPPAAEAGPTPAEPAAEPVLEPEPEPAS